MIQYDTKCCNSARSEARLLASTLWLHSLRALDFGQKLTFLLCKIG